MAEKKLSVEEKMEIIGEMPLGELQLRRRLINFAIRTCIEAGDPHGQVGNYRAQLGRIDEAIHKRRGNGSKPIIVNARPGRMGAKASL